MSRHGRLRLTLRTARSLPPKGLSTLGFDTGRFPPTPPACYRASWPLPGPDSHRQATTSLCWIRSPQSTTPNSGHTLDPHGCESELRDFDDDLGGDVAAGQAA